MGVRLLALALSALVQPVFAQVAPWPFEDHPHPDSAELTLEDIEHLNDGLDLAPEPVMGCRTLAANGFAIYNAHYPALKASGEVDARYRQWKKHIVDSYPARGTYCVLSLPSFELRVAGREFAAAGLIFCGAPLDPPATPLERRFVDLVSELFGNALTGQIEALKPLLFHHDTQRVVFLNQDIEYFVRRELERQRQLEPADWDVSHLMPVLDAARRGFLDAAVERNDLAAVAKTTAPCPLR
ncbi:MAG TPA: hypothetical protein VMW31_00280 [Devosiaceae bacterium]|nr:hypothetical protein [Devosiaceae bacterium]